MKQDREKESKLYQKCLSINNNVLNGIKTIK